MKPTDRSRHQRLSELFAEARSADAEARGALLKRIGAEDPSLAAELDDLLRHHQQAPRTEDLGRAIPVAGELRALAAQLGLSPQTSPSETLDPEQARPVPPEPGPHATIGRYTLLRELGEGGMGVVYLAEQDHPRRTVALKIMRQGFGLAATELRRRFELETQLLARLEHPGIARLYDAGTAPLKDAPSGAAVPYLVMEYVDGLPLLRHAESRGLGLRERLTLMLGICRAVAAAHRQGVIHRDLKPGNILVDTTGQPKILDFGVARAVSGDAAMTTAHTDIGQLVGTLPYMSPEQVSGDPRRIDARTDVYALGVVTYELLAGRLPLLVRDMAIPEAARRILDEDPVPLSTIDRSLRGDVNTIVAKAMEKDADRRYPSAEAMADDIQRWLEDEPILARPASTLYQLAKFARRNRGLVAGVMLAFLMLVAGLVGTTMGLVKARRSAEEAGAAKVLADEQRDAALVAEGRATRRFNDLRRLAKAFIYDVHDDIVDLPGSTEVRKDMLARGLEYLDSLATEAADDPGLQNELAEAYVKIGQAQGYYARGNLGDRDAALESFTKAARIRQALLAAEPEREQWQIGLLNVRNYIGNIHYSEGRYQQALEEFKAVRARREALVKSLEADPQRRREALRALSISWQWVGNSHLALKQEDEALEAYRAQLALAQELHVPGDVPSTRDLSVAHEKVGDGLRARGRTSEALAAYRANLELRRALSAAAPDNGELRSDLAVSLGRVARILLAAGEVEEAASLFTESRDILAQTAEADPRNILAQTNLAIAEYRLAEVAAARFDRAASQEEAVLHRGEGLAQFDRAIELLEDLHRDGRLEARYVEGIREIREAREKLEAKGG